ELARDHRLVSHGAPQCPHRQCEGQDDHRANTPGHSSRVVAAAAPVRTGGRGTHRIWARVRAAWPYDDRVTTLNLFSKDPARSNADALVIGVRSEGGSATVEGAAFLSRAAAESVARAITLLGVKIGRASCRGGAWG